MTLKLPNSERPVSRLVLGTMTFGERVDRAGARDMVAMALDAGVTWFDTANKYTGGTSERLLGDAVATRRDEVVLATKVRNAVDEHDRDAGLSREAIPRAVDASLARLRTDHIELLYFHRPDWEVEIEESLEAANELIVAGKIGELGLSNYPAWSIVEAQAISARRGWPPPRVHQLMYNLTARAADGEYSRFTERAGMLDVVYNPLAGGLLTGKHLPSGTPPDAPPDDGRFAQSLYRDRYWHSRTFEAVARLQQLAQEAGCSMVELAYRWLRGRDLTDAILIGASGAAQLQENLAAASQPPLEDALQSACDTIWDEFRGPVPAYWR